MKFRDQVKFVSSSTETSSDFQTSCCMIFLQAICDWLREVNQRISEAVFMEKMMSELHYSNRTFWLIHPLVVNLSNLWSQWPPPKSNSITCRENSFELPSANSKSIQFAETTSWENQFKTFRCWRTYLCRSRCVLKMKRRRFPTFVMIKN